MSEPLILPRNCGNCQHFDGEGATVGGWCALPITMRDRKLVEGLITGPDRVACSLHEPKDADDVEGAAV